MGYSMVSLLLFVVFIVLSRLNSHKALKHLSQEQKAQLVDLHSGQLRTRLLLIGVVILVIVGGTYIWPEYIFQTVAFFFLALVAFIAWHTFKTNQELRRLSFPENYIRLYTWSRVFNAIGFLFLSLPIFGVAWQNTM